MDKADPNGLMLRYPLGKPNGTVPPIPAGFDEHCEWPNLLRQMVAVVCDVTIAELPTSSEPCRNALRYLRCVVAAGDCLGGYLASETIDEDHAYWDLLTRVRSEFNEPVTWEPSFDTRGEWVCNLPVVPESRV